MYSSVRREYLGMENESKDLPLKMSAACMCTRRVSIFGMRLHVPYYYICNLGYSICNGKPLKGLKI